MRMGECKRMTNKEKLKSKYDWAGIFQTMSLKIVESTSEEQMYRILRAFKDEFNSEYGKISRSKRLTNGFRENDGE